MTGGPSTSVQPAGTGTGTSVGTGFRHGAVLLPRAFGLLRREQTLWLPAAIPAVLTALCLTAAGALVYANAGEILAGLSGALPSFQADAWYEWLWVGPAIALRFVAVGVLFVAATAVALVSGVLLATLLSSPVLDLLSQRVERVLTGSAVGDNEASMSAGVLRDALGSLLNEARRIGLFSAVWLGVTGVGLLLPFGPVLVPIALGAVAIAFLPLEYAGFALDRRRVSFAGRRAWLARHRPKSLGFGLAGFAIGLIPGLNFLLLPALIVAGTLFVLEAPPEEFANRLVVD